jgi:hypothetical protein
MAIKIWHGLAWVLMPVVVDQAPQVPQHLLNLNQHPRLFPPNPHPLVLHPLVLPLLHRRLLPQAAYPPL